MPETATKSQPSQGREQPTLVLTALAPKVKEEVKQQNPTLYFGTDVLRERWEATCNRVLSEFVELPCLRLLCYFDNEQFSTPLTGSFHGIHTPVIGHGDVIPYRVQTKLWDGDFDNVIYVPKSLYSKQPIGLVLIFAHELRHFVQYGISKSHYEASCRLFLELQSSPTPRKVWDVPYERDAMIESKRVAEAVFGPNQVNDFISQQIAGADAAKKALWQVFRGLSPSENYDWISATAALTSSLP